MTHPFVPNRGSPFLTLSLVFVAACHRPASTPKGAVEKPPCADVDLSRDPRHCGTCGHDCLGGACKVGVCAPVVFATEPSKVHGLLADDRGVVWRSGDGSFETWALRAKAWGAASTITLAIGKHVVRPMTLASRRVYWCEDDYVARVAAEGGGVERFAETHDACTALAADDREVFWCTSDGVVHAKPISGGAPRRVVGLPTAMSSLQVVGDSVFASQDHAAVRISRDRNTFVELSLPYNTGFMLDRDDVYVLEPYTEPGPFNEKSGSYGYLAYAIARTSLSKMSKSERLVDKQMNPDVPMSDGRHLYWGDGGIYLNPIKLRRLALPRGQAEELVTVPWSTGGYSFSGPRVVWNDGDAHTILALAK